MGAFLNMAKLTGHIRVVLSLLMLLCHVYAANKYSKDLNKNNEAFRDPSGGKDLFKKKLPQMYEERPFRILKVQLLWEKAKKRLPEAEWPEIFTDLKIQDKMELETKKIRTEGKDNFGDIEADTREKMLKIMKRYNLHDDRVEENETDKQEGDYFNVKKLKKKPNKYDTEFEQKLDKLWKKAELAGFSEEELEQLRREFVHHQHKIDEFNQLKTQLDVLGDNTVDGYRKPSPEDAKKNDKKDFKRRHHDLLDQFNTLEGSVAEKTGLDFNEPRVVELWMLAKKSNFSDVELESFKNELQHFEKRLQKLDFYKSQADYLKSGDPGKYGKHNEINVDGADHKQDHIFKKAEEHERKVKKLHYELKSKVANALGVSHLEL